MNKPTQPKGFNTLYNITPNNFPEPWASAYGQDEYGYWMEFTVENVVQRLRWVHPGDFIMGSPADELGHLGRELQHPVTLSEGYWLADTACTQALWQAVMDGNNPSKFQGETDSSERPVERVSWEDCSQMLRQLNNVLLGLNLRLPTEAEWEYACRAGAATSFSFGESASSNQANFDNSLDYIDMGPGLYRKQTEKAKVFNLNGWGLYQMHGNVLEWCQDWFYEDYDVEGYIDPKGPLQGTKRVFRGGSWYNIGKVMRSAYRDGAPPNIRGTTFSFRFAHD